MKRISIALILLVSLLFGKDNIAQVRTQTNIGGDWKFIKQAVTTFHPKTDDWETVTIPHTWNIKDGQSGNVGDEWDNGQGFYRGPGTYYKMLNIPESYLGKRIFLRFEAVSQTAEVFVNGQSVGKHEGAFNAFAFEITKFVKKGENELLVKASNGYDKNIAPLGGDFTLFGGIYRPVSLIVLNPVCISPLDYASPGVYVKQEKVTDSRAELEVKVKLFNQKSSPSKSKVKISILDKENRVVASSQATISIKETDTTSSIQKININNPHLWNGLKDAYLYTAFVEVIEGKKVLDTLTQKIGLRYYKIDAEKGFFLNGKPYKLAGVNKHQDYEGMGWAVTADKQEEDMRLIKEIGANAVRLAHYPHPNYFYSLCDANGLVVWAELPLVNNITGSKEFAANAKQQLTELIRQNFNHPSIFFWSLYNEMGHRKTDDPQQLITDLNALSHEEDPTRLTVAAPNHIERAEKSIPDVLAFNSYPGWYGGNPNGMEKKLTEWNDAINKKGIGVSEYGAGASINHHQQGMTKGPVTTSKWHPEEWQAIVHEANYKQIKEANFVWGSFVWNMFDFASAGRKEGEQLGTNDKGLVTYDRKTRKDAFYFYKANWNPEPMVYITSRRHLVRDTAFTDVKAYSNCSKVELLVNGKSLGNTTEDNHVFIWKNIQLIPGKNKIAIKGIRDGKEYLDECEWEYGGK